ncbi:MAG: hypothetical protein HQK84_02185 [Nitrospinae bacterium]|nr:hypothetical protein [Nitrospinota bacterium]
MRPLIVFLLLLIVSPLTSFAAEESAEKLKGKCMTCHKRESSGLYQQWSNSAHKGANVTCYSCHEAKKDEPDAFLHEGMWIATLVTPKDCGKCHEKEEKQVAGSHHAKAGEILASLDNYLAGVAGGLPVVIAGCEGCHGGKMEIDPKSPNKLSLRSWPNSGIGRINPDGSKGACNACHSRHSFSKKQARNPENCGKCHLGPDHPQKEVYEESKHGIAFRAHKDKLNMEKDKWVVGVDYYQAPTCATCHMSATSKQKVTHDVGDRLSWNLRPPVSKPKENSKANREKMMDVCQACHGKRFADGFYRQFDGVVNLYDEKFGKPAKEIFAILKKNKSLKNQASFSNDVEWLYWELWHHEGRRARHGAAMMAPDYTWWHGIYEVAKHFYMKYIPAVRKLDDKEANAYIDKLLESDWHKWFKNSSKETQDALKSGATAKSYEGLFVPPWERK